MMWMMYLLILVIPPSATGKSFKGCKKVMNADWPFMFPQEALKEREPSCDRSIYRARRR